MWEMPPSTKVCEVGMITKSNFAFIKIVNEFSLEWIFFVLIICQSFFFGNSAHREWMLFTRHLNHSFFNGIKIFFRYGMTIWINIVVKPLLDSRSDGEFYSRVMLRKNLCEYVSRRMPKCFFSFGIVPCIKHKISIDLEMGRSFNNFTVVACRQHVSS